LSARVWCWWGVLMGGMSTSKWPSLVPAGVLFSTRSWCAAAVCRWWCRGVVERRVLVGVGWSVAHYWVLRQQVPADGRRLLLFPVVGGGGGWSGGGGGVVSGFPASRRWWSTPSGVLPLGCGVCGLLFENCIVDASIFLNRCRCVRGRCCSLGGGGVRVVVVSCS
jgi:hypothetical protein